MLAPTQIRHRLVRLQLPKPRCLRRFTPTRPSRRHPRHHAPRPPRGIDRLVALGRRLPNRSSRAFSLHSVTTAATAACAPDAQKALVLSASMLQRARAAP